MYVKSKDPGGTHRISMREAVNIRHDKRVGVIWIKRHSSGWAVFSNAAELGDRHWLGKIDVQNHHLSLILFQDGRMCVREKVRFISFKEGLKFLLIEMMILIFPGRQVWLQNCAGLTAAAWCAADGFCLL